MMATAERLPFSWRDVESLPDLERLRLVLDVLPDEEIVAALEAGRGRGRNDSPVRAMWRSLIAGIVFQHPSIQSLLGELGRNPALLEICGFDPLPFQGAPVTELRGGTREPCALTHTAAVRDTVPSHWNFSRFLGRLVWLEGERGLVSAMIEILRASLFEEVPDFGRHLGYDGKAIESHSTGRVPKGGEYASDPDADWGKHGTSGVNGKSGAIWKKVKSWFGYGLHLIADTRYEVPVAFAVTRASGPEAGVLPGMLEDLFAKAPRMADRCADFSAGRGLDNGLLKARLWDSWAIRPLIDTRQMWRAEKDEPGHDPAQPITRAMFPDRADVVVHDERGRVSCICPETGEERAMAFQGRRHFLRRRGALAGSEPARPDDSVLVGLDLDFDQRGATLAVGDIGLAATRTHARIFRGVALLGALLEPGPPGAAVTGSAALLAALAPRTWLLLPLALAPEHRPRQHRPGRPELLELDLQRLDARRQRRLLGLQIPHLGAQPGVFPAQRRD